MKITNYIITPLIIATAALFVSCGDNKNELESNNEYLSTEYQVNNADQIIFKRFEGHYEVTSTLGKRNGLNSLEILLSAIDSMDWTDATPHLKSAVNEVASIQSGEAPASRSMKMKKFMEYYNKY